ncbi:MAG: hypothetical protein ACJ8BW_08625 [Ktedonobacteraceae bacterium]
MSSRKFLSVFVGGVLGFEILIIPFMLLHIGGNAWTFAQLAGALIGGAIALISVNIPMSGEEMTEPLLGRERLAWTLVGCGLIAWGIGESFWRYYVLTNQSPFPSYADFGYASLPPLMLAGFIMLPSSGSENRRALLFLDSLIVMGSMLAIGWYLLLGDLALHSTQKYLGQFLTLYYPTTDVALLSCAVILLLRGQGRFYQATARRVSMLVVVVGLCFFAVSDFSFNFFQNAGTYVEGTWVDVGWPLGLITIGLGVYLRRFLPSTSSDQIELRLRRRVEHVTFGIEQLLPYILLSILFVVLVLNIVSTDPGQRDIRPTLVLATIAVVGLVVVRQILTLMDNERLTRRQADALQRLEMANKRIEEQARMIAERNAELEMGVTHLKDVQANLANGNMRVRARLSGGALLPLAASLNLMADRLMRLEQSDLYAQRLSRALNELSVSIERYRQGGPLIIPTSCNDFAEINRLLFVTGLKERADVNRARHPSVTGPTTQPVQPNQGPRTPLVNSHSTHSGPLQPRSTPISWPEQQTWPASSSRSQGGSGPNVHDLK